ncbi:AraC family transcriptional regulator [Dickeya chrysanthemi]|uniref:helix-turn-helix transcriptional regulator n=1 Tax=Dickeya chrysanthemi TaxID=556 RepID=UPI003019DA17
MNRSSATLRASDLTERSDGRIRLVSGAQSDEPLVEGRVIWSHLRDGLTLHCCDCVELQHIATECRMEPRLAFLLVEGDTQVRYDDETVNFHPSRAGNQGMQGLALSFARPLLFKGRTQPGRRIRRLVVNIGAEWLESSKLDSPMLGDALPFVTSDMAACLWYPSARLKATVAQMLSPPDYTPMVQKLYLESRVLDVVTEAFSSIVGKGNEASISLRPQEYRRIQQVMSLLNSGEADDWSLDRIAEDAGINVNSLQKQFRQVTGMTVFEYQRGRRLAAARHALEREGLTVAQAAWLAGYNSAANFATAFKRRFGMTPKQVKARI